MPWAAGRCRGRGRGSGRGPWHGAMELVCAAGAAAVMGAVVARGHSLEWINTSTCSGREQSGSSSSMYRKGQGRCRRRGWSRC